MMENNSLYSFVIVLLGITKILKKLKHYRETGRGRT